MPLDSWPGVNGHSQFTASASPSSSRKSSISTVAIPPVLDNDHAIPPLNGISHGNGDASILHSTSLPPAADTSKPLPAVRRASKFRHVPLRPSKSPLPSSPLRPPNMHSRSTSSSTTHQPDQPSTRPETDSRSRLTSLSSVAFDPPTEKALPPIVPSATGSSSLMPDPIRPTPDRPLPQPTEAPAPRLRPVSLGPPQVKLAAPTTISATTSTASSVSQTPPTVTPSTTPRPSAPYRPGFQPKGVYRPRTDEFTEHRKQIHDRDRIERTKLERRLEKLIDLHFPRDGVVTAAHPPVNRRASSFFDFNISDLRSGDSGLWKGVMQGAKGDIRGIVRFLQLPKMILIRSLSHFSASPFSVRTTDHSMARRLGSIEMSPLLVSPQYVTYDSNQHKICVPSASFLPLSNRKHHCRLCGKVICSLPVKHPQRPVTCSLLFVVDSKTRRIEEVGEGVDYGVRKRRGSAPMQKGKEKEELPSEDEKFLKGVRICRQCHPILLCLSLPHLYLQYLIILGFQASAIPARAAPRPSYRQTIPGASHGCDY